MFCSFCPIYLSDAKGFAIKFFREETKMAGVGVNNGLGTYAAQADYRKDVNRTEQKYGKTVGTPQLSEKAQKYYEQLKKKYGNYDFVLVSEDEKENAKANAAKYANSFKTVVLIDENKIEQMASDEKFRKQYEGILSGASEKMQQLKDGMGTKGAAVKGYGIQVNDNGTLSFFAVLKKSSAQQKARIEKKAEQRKAEQRKAEKEIAEKKVTEKKASEKEKAGKLKETAEEEEVTITANSVEELLSRIEAYRYEERSDVLQTESEKQVGQHIDFKG